MKRVVAVVALCVLGPSGLVAQPVPAGMKVGLTDFLRFGYEGIKQNLVAAADRMPEAAYGTKPHGMAGGRTYGQIFAHVAEGQSDACAAGSGVPNPTAGRQLEAELTTKAEIAKALADSFAVCDNAFSSLTDANAADMVPRGQGHISRAALLVGVLAHGSEMYGISTVYLRARGLTPPASR
jgi:hypothetical protein